MNKLQMQIFYYKQKLGLTNEDLAKRTGVSKETISRLCKGATKDPKSETLRVIAKAFGISVDELIGTDDNVEPYFFDSETAEIAEQVKNNSELKLLLDSAKDLSPDELRTFLGMIDILKKK